MAAPLPRVLATDRLPGTALDRLAAETDLWLWPEREPIPRDVLWAQLPAAAGLLRTGDVAIDASLLDAAPALRVAGSFSVGLDGIDVAECTRRGLPVGYTPTC